MAQQVGADQRRGCFRFGYGQNEASWIASGIYLLCAIMLLLHAWANTPTGPMRAFVWAPPLVAYANALGFLGRHQEARDVMARATAMNPHLSQEEYLSLVLPITGSPERAEPHIGGLFAAGIFKR